MTQVPEKVDFNYSYPVRTSDLEKVDASKNLVARVPCDSQPENTKRTVWVKVSGEGEVYGYRVDDHVREASGHTLAILEQRYSQTSVNKSNTPEELARLEVGRGLSLAEVISYGTLAFRELRGSSGPRIHGSQVSYGVHGTYRTSSLFAHVEEGDLTGLMGHLRKLSLVPRNVMREGDGPKRVVGVEYEIELDEKEFNRDRLPVERLSEDYRHVDVALLIDVNSEFGRSAQGR